MPLPSCANASVKFSPFGWRNLPLTWNQAPEDPGWPSAAEWKALNASVSGKLIADVQPAVVCYPGPSFDEAACDAVNAGLHDQTYISNTPIGLSWPTQSCPPVNRTAGETAGSCSIGDQPRYTVNATEPAHVAKGVLFARKHGIRLVVRNTGHDLLGRCVGRRCSCFIQPGLVPFLH